MAEDVQKRKLVTLVAIETLTPYKAGEVFSVSEEDAALLLTPSREKNDFGAKYPRVKVRKFDPRVDGERLLDEGSLNVEAHNALQKKLRPALPELKKQSTEVENSVTSLLDEAGYEPTELGDDAAEIAANSNATTPAPRRSRASADDK